MHTLLTLVTHTPSRTSMWTRSVSLACLLCAFAAAAPSCTNAKLEEVPPEPIYRDDKLEISGHICTQEPETLVFPLRVLFVVDASVSMEVTDPPDPVTGETGRERAVRETWEHLLEQGPEGVRVGIIRFSSEAQSRTASDLDGDGIPDTYFTTDRTLLGAATSSLGVTDRTTNFGNAISEAYYEIRTELMGADLESLPLSRYIVIFLSDGVPDVDNADARGNINDNIREGVEAIQNLADTFRVGSFAFHTAYVSGGQSAVFDQLASDLLISMADEGEGTFRSFANGEELNFLFIDFSIMKRVFTLKTLVAMNFNVSLDASQIPSPPPVVVEGEALGEDVGDVGDISDVDVEEAPPPSLNPNTFVDLNSSGWIECGEPMVDTDGDGLTDLIEIEIGTDPWLADTDDDGLGDRLDWEFSDSGLDPLVIDEACFVANTCAHEHSEDACDCLLDVDIDSVCDCVTDSNIPCANDEGRDCVDLNEDGWCDCPDVNDDGYCDYDDDDGDGLRDCEEVFFGTAQKGADTDADGLPDPFEIRFQTNPTVADDREDQDFDHTPNGVEIMSGTNPLCDDAALRSRMSYRYQLDDLGLEGATSCYDFHIENITLVPTLALDHEARATASADDPMAPPLPGPYNGNGWNRILIYAGEAAFDDPNAFASYRVACVLAAYNPDGGYKNPPSGHLSLSEADFVKVSEFDPATHCIVP